MALSHVAKLTLAYRRGEVDASRVVAALDRRPPRPRLRIADLVRRRGAASEDLDEEPAPANTWEEVLRFWDILDERQRAELRTARNAREAG